MSTCTLEQLKSKLGGKLVNSDLVKSREGIPTGLAELDHFLLWKGFPRGAVSLLVSSLGRGATSLWGQTAAPLTQQKKWVAWINSTNAELCPWSLHQAGADFSRVLVVSPPDGLKNISWILQELLSLSLFEMIGCDLGNSCLSEKDLARLSPQTRKFDTALILSSTNPFIRRSSLYSLILNFNAEQIGVERAQHRSTPHFIVRKNSYENLMHQLRQDRTFLSG
jgi:hypothetical protein